MAWSVGGDWNFSYQQISGSWNGVLLKYKNTSSTPQLVTACKIGMATGNGTYSGVTTVTGNGQPYNVYVKVTDSNGTSHTSNTITVSNKTSGSNNYTTQKKTFTFSGVYVAAGATVSFRFYFTETASGYPVIILRDRNTSSTYGGTVINGGGLVRINIDGTANGWKNAIPYVNVDGTANGWKIAIPYINKDGSATGWTICT